MFIRAIRPEEKDIYNKVVHHPLQSWEWGEFKKLNGQQVERIGMFEGSKMLSGLQVSFHSIPFFNKTVGYLPKAYMPDSEQLAAVRQLAQKHKALFVKLEPNIAKKVTATSAHDHVITFLLANDATPGRPLFTKFTFQLDLTQPEEILFQNLESKTRYNVNLAHKKGVSIFENTSKEGMEQYIEILEETTKRQGFYAHSPEYFRDMWQALGGSGMLRIFNAVYQDTVITSWIMFVFNDVLYYPYGASRAIHRDVMANNLMMWEMIMFGKRMGCRSFDMWGSLGPDADPKHSWYGFHKFKKGYGGDLVEFLGSFDYVVDHPLYKLFSIADSIRWKLLRFKTKIGL